MHTNTQKHTSQTCKTDRERESRILAGHSQEEKNRHEISARRLKCGRDTDDDGRRRARTSEKIQPASWQAGGAMMTREKITNDCDCGCGRHRHARSEPRKRKPCWGLANGRLLVDTTTGHGTEPTAESRSSVIEQLRAKFQSFFFCARDVVAKSTMLSAELCPFRASGYVRMLLNSESKNSTSFA